MSQWPDHRYPDWSQTLHGFGYDAQSPPSERSEESRFVRIGARVGQSGQVFETDGGAGRGALVVKLFAWRAEQPRQVVRDFTREAMTVARLRHPHIAQVVDVGTLGAGTPFVVMERLAGTTLEEAAMRRTLPNVDILPILRGVASALSAAHAVGITHGEVRADNVFIAEGTGYRRACPKLLDFGVARLGAWPAPALGSRAGERADQRALAELAGRIIGGMPAPAIEQVLSRAMSPDPSQRFATIVAFMEALEESFVEAATRPPIGAPTAAVASSLPSLTQQFFADGEQLEKAHAASQANRAAGARNGDDGEPQTAAGVPRSRTQMLLAALLALGSVAVIAWTVVSLASKSAGGPPTAGLALPAADRPVISTAPVHAPAPTVERGPRGAAVGRAVRLRSQRPAAGGPLTIPPPVPPTRPSTPIPDRATPETPPPRPTNEDVAQPGDEAGGEPSGAVPMPEPGEAAPTPPAPEVPPTPPAPDSPAPAAAPSRLLELSARSPALRVGLGPDGVDLIVGPAALSHIDPHRRRR
jgi:serine/threonine-protein kinase